MRISKGQRYRAKSDVKVQGLIPSAIMSGGFIGIIRKGEAIVIRNDPPEGATAIYACPEEYAAFEREFVPKADLDNPDYSGYALAIQCDDLAKNFLPVGEGD